MFLNNRQLEYETIKLLAEKNIPITAIKLIMGSDIEETAQKIELFENEIDKVAEIIVNNRLRGKAPANEGFGRGSYLHSVKDESTKNAVRNIIRR